MLMTKPAPVQVRAGIFRALGTRAHAQAHDRRLAGHRAKKRKRRGIVAPLFVLADHPRYRARHDGGSHQFIGVAPVERREVEVHGWLVV
jgi:hypothetical protein